MENNTADARQGKQGATAPATASASSTTTKPKQLQRTNPSRIKRDEAKGGRSSLERKLSMYHPEDFANRELPLIYKPKVIKKIDDHVYTFHCVTKGNTGCKFNKNMVVLVHENRMEGNLLSIVNPLRLTEEGEAHLNRLGRVRNLIRLGPSEHATFEDEYYLKQYANNPIQRWAPGKFSDCPHLPLDFVLHDTTNTRQLKVDDPIHPPTPHPDIQVFAFEETVQPEAMLYLSTSKRLLITGDCLQAQRDNSFINDLGKTRLADNGLLVENNDTKCKDKDKDIVVISPLWLKLQCVVSNHSRKTRDSFRSNQAQRNRSFFTSSGKFKLRNDFQRLLQLEIKRLVSTSGNHVQHEAGIRDWIAAAAEQACQLV